MASNQAMIKDVNLDAVPDSASELPAPLAILSDALMWTMLKKLLPIVDLQLKESFSTHTINNRFQLLISLALSA